MKTACIGAGPAGLYFAIMTKLRMPETEVTIFERNRADVTHGWGVGWNGLDADFRADDPGLAEAIVERSFPWSGQVIDVWGGSATHPRTARSSMPSRPGYGISRQTLLDILRTRAVELGATIHFQHEITSATQLPEADLVVGADGCGSILRRGRESEFGPRIEHGRNKYVWLATPRLFEDFTWGFVSTPAGWIWCHAYGYSETMSTFIVECSPETWQGLGMDRLDTAESLQVLERIFGHHLGDHHLVSSSAAGESLPWLSYRTLTNRRWHSGNAVLLGDAAHTTHFSIGSGTRMAMLDAVALANSLHRHRDIPGALAAYEAERQVRMRRPQRGARLSAAWFENVPRYATLDVPALHASLRLRTAPFVHRVPPRLHYPLHRMSTRLPVSRRVYRSVATRVEQLSGLQRRLQDS